MAVLAQIATKHSQQEESRDETCPHPPWWLHAIIEDKDQLEGPKSESYDASSLRSYFSDDAE